MTIKKSDVLALLDTLPDEFEESDLHSLVDYASFGPIELSEQALSAVHEGLDNIEAGQGISFLEYKERMAQWRSKLLSQANP